MTSRASARAWTGSALLAATIALPALLLGGTHAGVHLALLLTFAAGLGVRLSWRRRRSDGSRRSLRWHPLAVGLGAFALLSWAQALPLPVGLLRTVSPVAADAYAAVDEAFGAVAGAAPLSLDPAASLRAGVRWAGLAFALLLLVELDRAGKRRALIVRVLVWTGSAVVALGLVGLFAGGGRVLGFFSPLHPGARVGLSGPFVAANHAGQFLVVCLLAALDGARRGGRGPARYRAVAAVAWIALGIGLTRSRGAIVAGALGLVLSVAIALKRRDRAALVAPAWALAVGLAGVGLATLVWPEVATLARWETLTASADLGKLSQQVVAFELIVRSPWTGLGADAFGAAQVALATHPNPVRMRAIENDWLQTVLDFGVAGTLLVVVLVAWAARSSSGSSQRRGGRPLGAIALVAVGAQSLVSFGLLSSGVVVALLALLVATWLRPRSSGGRAARAVVVGALVLGTAGGVMAWAEAARVPDEAHALARRRPTDARHLWVAALTPGVEEGVRSRVASLAFARSGNDYPLQLALATHALRAGDTDTAWERFSRAASEDFQWAARAWNERTGWLERGSASAQVAQVAALARARARFGELTLGVYRARGLYAAELSLALALEESPTSLAHRARAAAGLGSMEQARLWAERLEQAFPDDAGACLTAVDIEVAAGASYEDGLNGLLPCFDRFGDEPALLRRAVDWATRSEHVARDWDESLSTWTRALNLASADDGAAVAQYRALLARVQAARGQCRAAERSLGLAETDRSEWGVWLRERCPGGGAGDARGGAEGRSGDAP